MPKTRVPGQYYSAEYHGTGNPLMSVPSHPNHTPPGPVGRTLEDVPVIRDLIRLGYVKRAWDLAQRKYAGPAIVRLVGNEFYKLVEGLIPGLLMALGVVMTTSLLGAVIGAALGAFAFGVGAAPGSAMGAGAGLEIGLLLLNALGLGFVLKEIISNLPKVGALVQEGIVIAWNARGDEGKIDTAAKRMGEGVGVFFVVLIEGLFAYAFARGLTSTLANLRRSKFGAPLADWLQKNYESLKTNPKFQQSIVSKGGGTGSGGAQQAGGEKPARPMPTPAPATEATSHPPAPLPPAVQQTTTAPPAPRTGRVRPDLSRASPKKLRQMQQRGWTQEQVSEAFESGEQSPAINKATGGSATRYVHPKTGQSVVIDDATGQPIHLGGPGFKYGPGSGDRPK